MPRSPNVLLILSDQQRHDSLGSHGNPMGITPQLDRMARYGTDFELAFSPNPVCGPARSSLLTGRYPTNTGVHVNGPSLGEQRTLAHVFADAGYHTGYIGKWHLAPSDPVTKEFRGGFETWLAANTLEFTSDAYRTIVFDEDNLPVQLPGYRADALTDAAISFLAQHHDEPFFLMLSYIEPHHQNEVDTHPAPEGYAERLTDVWTPPDLVALGGNSARQLPGYYGQIQKLDECVGRLRDALRSLDLTDDTVVVYTSDHGSHFRSRNSEYKRSVHDASIRVPLLLTGGPFTCGGTRSEVVSTVDLPVTLAHLVHGELDAPDGDSFLPLIDRSGPWRHDAAFVQISESQTARALRTPAWAYVVSAEGDPDRPGAEVYVEESLYDVVNDPWELDNLIHHVGLAETADRLRERLLDEIERVEHVRVEIRPAERSNHALRTPTTIAQRDRITPDRIGWPRV